MRRRLLPDCLLPKGERSPRVVAGSPHDLRIDGQFTDAEESPANVLQKKNAVAVIPIKLGETRDRRQFGLDLWAQGRVRRLASFLATELHAE